MTVNHWDTGTPSCSGQLLPAIRKWKEREQSQQAAPQSSVRHRTHSLLCLAYSQALAADHCERVAIGWPRTAVWSARCGSTAQALARLAGAARGDRQPGSERMSASRAAVRGSARCSTRRLRMLSTASRCLAGTSRRSTEVVGAHGLTRERVPRQSQEVCSTRFMSNVDKQPLLQHADTLSPHATPVGRHPGK